MKNNSYCVNTEGSFNCTCLSGYEGPTCTDVNECLDSNICSWKNNSYCVNTKGYYNCTCLTGYAGHNCTDIDECAQGQNNCVLNSKCNNTEGSYVCNCNSGYEGPNCTDINECTRFLDNCDNNAKCQNTPGSFKCSCVSGLKGNGTFCEDIDECTNQTDNCSAGERCENSFRSYICICSAGYKRVNSTCEDIDECQDMASCPENGQECVNTEGSFTCECRSGFQNINETCKDINECLNAEANNCSKSQGLCANLEGSYHCQCIAGYTGNGFTCSDIDECLDGNICSMKSNSYCVNTDGSFNCTCLSGYEGPTCTDVNECLDSNICSWKNNSYCVNTKGYYNCTCLTGYAGHNCTDIDECLDSNTCSMKNNSYCVNTEGSFNCTCLSGYEGPTCTAIDTCVLACTNAECFFEYLNEPACQCNRGFEIGESNTVCRDINECDSSNKCGQVCKNTLGSYECFCWPGYLLNQGDKKNCSDIDECANPELNDCEHICQNIPGRYKCACNPGFKLDNENEKNCIDINECLSNPCSRKGQCTNTPGSFNCTCVSGFTGRLCSEDIDECSSYPCVNGKCLNIPGSFKCQCDRGFTGQTCETDIDECHSQPCMNGATCLDQINNFTCACSPGYTGQFCQRLIDNCASEPCQNTGFCQNHINNYTCICTKNWKGRDCSTDVDECSLKTDNCDRRGGTCTNTIGSFMCSCKEGYEGDGITCREKRLFKYGPQYGDRRISRVALDLNSPTINIPTGFPFDDTFYYRLYFSDNGLITFQRNLYVQYIYSAPFRAFSRFYYRIPSMIAVFWDDADVTRGIGNIYYQSFDFQERQDNHSQNFQKDLGDQINESYGSELGINFQPKWALRITWENMLPFTGYRNVDLQGTNTYQAVLITDGIFSFCLIKFQDGGMNWKFSARPSRQNYALMGYYSESTSFFFNDPQTRFFVPPEKIYRPDKYPGHKTGKNGQWAYRLERNNIHTRNPRQKCVDWYLSEPFPYWSFYTSPCPCSIWQAIFDNSFTWGQIIKYYGFEVKGTQDTFWTYQSRFPNRLGSGVRCYYSFNGGLIYGEKERFLPAPWTGFNFWAWIWRGYSYYLQQLNYYYNVFLPRVQRSYSENEVDPYNNCCRDSGDSYFCSLYYSRRPLDFCFGYIPPRIGFFFGDPHVVSLDGVKYTFNGLGEFILLNSKDENDTVVFRLQGRTIRAGENRTSEATNFIALAAEGPSGTKVQWNLINDDEIILLIDGNIVNVTENSTYINQVTVQITDNNETQASFEGGTSITVSGKMGALSFTTALDNSFKNKTEGLLGVWNDDKTDDFKAADGQYLEFDGTDLPNDTQIFFDFGLTWKTTENNSVFTYNTTEGESWYTYNNNSFVPKFYDELLQTTDKEKIDKANETCKGNDDCIFDILSTDDFAFGASTLQSVTSFAAQNSTMNNFPPNITGESSIQTRLGEPVFVLFTAVDANDDNVIFSVLTNSSDITMTESGNFSWHPTSSSPVFAIIQANDSKATSELGLTLTICNCSINSTCDYTRSIISMQNNNTMFVVAACNCTPAYTGDYCTEDFDACEDNPCFVNDTCKDQPAPLEGHTCGPCPDNLQGDGEKCYDLDECQENTDTCEQICTNTFGSYNCSCEEGYAVNTTNSSMCDDIDECSRPSTCPKNADCINTMGNFTCVCQSGYNGKPYEFCVDVDECIESTDCSGNNFICTNTEGSFNCTCRTGYGGPNCTDIDECAQGQNNCVLNSKCNNTEGSYVCNCNSGYEGPNCTDINECTRFLDNCDNNAKCQNTPGSFKCSCMSGLKGNGTFCEDIDECTNQTDNCSAGERCENSFRSYICICSAGYKRVNSTCEDIDECQDMASCPENGQECVNTEGSFTCECRSGFQNINETCKDINECLNAEANNCSKSQGLCANLEGSYHCQCIAGYTGNGFTCSDIDECLDGNICSMKSNSYCVNTDGSFNCTCLSGYEGPTCTDVNECLDSNICSWKNNSYCVNTKGSYNCTCLTGYSGHNCTELPSSTSATASPSSATLNQTSSPANGSIPTTSTVTSIPISDSTIASEPTNITAITSELTGTSTTTSELTGTTTTTSELTGTNTTTSEPTGTSTTTSELTGTNTTTSELTGTNTTTSEPTGTSTTTSELTGTNTTTSEPTGTTTTTSELTGTTTTTSEPTGTSTTTSELTGTNTTTSEPTGTSTATSEPTGTSTTTSEPTGTNTTTSEPAGTTTTTSELTGTTTTTSELTGTNTTTSEPAGTTTTTSEPTGTSTTTSEPAGTTTTTSELTGTTTTTSEPAGTITTTSEPTGTSTTTSEPTGTTTTTSEPTGTSTTTSEPTGTSTTTSELTGTNTTTSEPTGTSTTTSELTGTNTTTSELTGTNTTTSEPTGTSTTTSELTGTNTTTSEPTGTTTTTSELTGTNTTTSEPTGTSTTTSELTGTNTTTSEPTGTSTATSEPTGTSTTTSEPTGTNTTTSEPAGTTTTTSELTGTTTTTSELTGTNTTTSEPAGTTTTTSEPTGTSTTTSEPAGTTTTTSELTGTTTTTSEPAGTITTTSEPTGTSTTTSEPTGTTTTTSEPTGTSTTTSEPTGTSTTTSEPAANSAIASEPTNITATTSELTGTTATTSEKTGTTTTASKLTITTTATSKPTDTTTVTLKPTDTTTTTSEPTGTTAFASEPTSVGTTTSKLTSSSTTTSKSTSTTKTTSKPTTTTTTTTTTMSTTAQPIQSDGHVILFPYGDQAGDKRLKDSSSAERATKINNFVSPTFEPKMFFTFGKTRLPSIYFTENGLIVFPLPNSAKYNYPNPFQNGFQSNSQPPMIAVFWINAYLSHGEVFYQEYETFGLNPSNLVQTVEKMIEKNFTITYKAKWTLKITWVNVTADPSSPVDESNTFQAVITTDGTYSFVLMLYKFGAMNWDVSKLPSKNVVIGYNSGSGFFKNDEQMNLPDSERFKPDKRKGANADLQGLWVYQLNQNNSQINYRAKCLQWYYLEPSPSQWNQSLSACPCTFPQGQRDRQFQFFKSDTSNKILRRTNGNIFNASQRCIYTKNGAFIEGWQERYWIPITPLSSSSMHQDSDLNPYKWCCEKVDDPKFCDFYKEKRPSITCEEYRPPGQGLGNGDPHFFTLDGHPFTFNGLGDFVLLNINESNGTTMFQLHARTVQTGEANATNFAAFAARHRSTKTITVQMTLKGNDTIDVQLNDMNVQFTPTEDNKEVYYEDNFYLEKEGKSSMLALFENGISLKLTARFEMLSIVPSLPKKYMNKTQGLLGLWNDNQNDDFTMPNGSIVPANSSESTLFRYGLTWEVPSDQSIFTIQSVIARAANNMFTPVFLDEFQQENMILYNERAAACNNNTQCIYDVLSTGNIEIGLSTANTITQLNEDMKILNSFPPTIEGNSVISTKLSAQMISYYTVTQQNGNVVFTPYISKDLNITGNGTLIWLPTNRNGLTVDVEAVDSNNLTSVLRPQLVLCDCGENGECNYNSTTRITGSSVYLTACICKDGFTGLSCQSPVDTCQALTCFTGVNCSSSGCGSCPAGLSGDGIQCLDIDECKDENPCSPNATCINTVRSYNCTCNDGFSGNGTYCSDITECSTCSPNAVCKDTGGKFKCICNERFTGNGTTCTPLPGPCDSFQCPPTFCRNFGTCSLNPSLNCTPVCRCPSPYTGERCTLVSLVFTAEQSPDLPKRVVNITSTLTNVNEISEINPNLAESIRQKVLEKAKEVQQFNNISEPRYWKREGNVVASTDCFFNYNGNRTVIDFLNEDLHPTILTAFNNAERAATPVTDFAPLNSSDIQDVFKLTRNQLLSYFSCNNTIFSGYLLQWDEQHGAICQSPCDMDYCLNQAECQHQPTGPMCKCVPRTIYDSFGERCEHLAINLRAFFGILFGALAFLLLLMLAIFLCVWKCNSSGRSRFSNDSDSISYENRQIFSWQGNPFSSKLNNTNILPSLDEKNLSSITWKPHLDNVNPATEIKIERPSLKRTGSDSEIP
ncbi:uncharacterized protein LOC134345238 [Mobula hypostoma]|uniref:uncharacterized protein LOC134345238 n=1 Tax=Mobula hypostoma TaxID=723540 RepID=UPI002FC280DF